MYNRDEKVNWNDVNFKKESSMAWLNAMNNASVLMASWIPLLGKLEEEAIISKLESLRDKIYKLNMTKIDYDAAEAVSPEDLTP